MWQDITIEMIYGFMIVMLAILECFNLISTAKRNAAEDKKRANAPMEDLSEMVKAMDLKLGTDKRRLDDHDERLVDMRKGLMAVCEGVQSLIEHEIHDGNTDEMADASKNLDRWLRGRP